MPSSMATIVDLLLLTFRLLGSEKADQPAVGGTHVSGRLVTILCDSRALLKTAESDTVSTPCSPVPLLYSARR